MNTTYQTLIVKFSEPITALDGIFDDTGAWGTDTLKGWIDDYESTRFTATDSHTAVIMDETEMSEEQTEITSKETAADAETAAAENADENVADDFDEIDLTAEDSDSTEE